MKYNRYFWEALTEAEESRIPLTEGKIEQLITDALKELASLGPEFDVLAHTDVLPLNIDTAGFRGTLALGHCGLGVTRATGKFGFACEIGINRHLFYEGLEDVIKNNVLHEACHYLQDVEMIKTGKLVVAEDGSVDDMLDEQQMRYFRDDAGHSECWWKYVNIVNDKISLKYPVTARADEVVADVVAAYTDDDWKYKLFCTECGQKTLFLDIVSDEIPIPFLAELTREYDNGYGFTNTACGECGGTVEIEFRDEAAHRDMKHMLAICMLKDLFGGLR